MDFKELTDPQEIEALIALHNALFQENPNHVVVCDVETTAKDPREALLLDVQLSGEKPESAVLFAGEYADALLKLEAPLVFHNFKYDLHVLHRYGINLLSKKIHDTMLLHHLLDENKAHDLDSIVQENWQDDYKSKFWAAYASYQEAPSPLRLDYACRDVVYTERLYRLLRNRLTRDDIPEKLIAHVHALAKTLYLSEVYGVEIDMPYLMDLGVKIKGKIEEIKPKLREAVPVECEIIEMRAWSKELAKRKTDKGKANVEKPEFSWSSSKQLLELLYGELELPAQVNEKTKNPTVDDAALARLEGIHPVIPLIREYRENEKIYGTYIKGTLDRASGGTIYPSFNVNGTTTGRISHSNPNLGNLPRQGGIRGIFKPRQGHSFISADYSQLEVCLAYHFSHDQNLFKILTEGLSQHDITAQSLGLERNAAKTLNFAMQYRCSPWKVAQMLSIPIKKATEIWNKYWEAYAGLKGLMDECDATIDRGCPIISPYGRRRHFEMPPEGGKRNPKEYRQAFNALIQGTGGDMTNRAFYLIGAELRKERWGRALFTVHDEIIIEVQNTFAEEAKRLLIEIMIQRGAEIGMQIPLKVEAAIMPERWED